MAYMSKTHNSWDALVRKYRIYIKLERGLSDNTVESYMRDVGQFADFVIETHDVAPADVTQTMVEEFMYRLHDKRVEKSTQGRMLSGIKSFYQYLLLTDAIDKSPTEFIDHPKTGHALPDTLDVAEIDLIIGSIDLSAPQGHRNKAMLEPLDSCGLRVSELISLRLSDIFMEEGFIRVIGKGSKQRLVPVSGEWKRQLQFWLEDRRLLNVDEKSADIVFLNRRGKALSRVMVFNIIKEAVAAAGIDKSVSPHTFRHSFATHLLQGGANIRQVQELLGHESITTTEIYTHLDSDHLRRTITGHHPLGKIDN
jgi:integrase/recombinase XerD